MAGWPAFLPADRQAHAQRGPCACTAVPDLTLQADTATEAAALLAADDPLAAVTAALWARNVEIARLKKRRRA